MGRYENIKSDVPFVPRVHSLRRAARLLVHATACGDGNSRLDRRLQVMGDLS